MLNYKNFDDLIAAFKKNNNFTINTLKNGVYINSKVTSMNIVQDELAVVCESFFINGAFDTFVGFGLDGVYKNDSDYDCREWKLEEVVPVVKSFIDRFTSGEKLVCLKERSYVTQIVFNISNICVKLLDENGICCISGDYNIDGTHKVDSELDLTFGSLPEKIVMYTACYLSKFGEVGVYQNNTNKDNYIIVIFENKLVLEYNEETNYIYFPNMNYSSFYEDKNYVLTDKKFNFSIVK
jgi:hypothetical protein